MLKPKIKLTHEWQYIPEECQADGIPAHYFMDQETGRTYAKLLRTGQNKCEDKPSDIGVDDSVKVQPTIAKVVTTTVEEGPKQLCQSSKKRIGNKGRKSKLAKNRRRHQKKEPKGSSEIVEDLNNLRDQVCLMRTLKKTTKQSDKHVSWMEGTANPSNDDADEDSLSEEPAVQSEFSQSRLPHLSTSEPEQKPYHFVAKNLEPKISEVPTEAPQQKTKNDIDSNNNQRGYIHETETFMETPKAKNDNVEDAQTDYVQDTFPNTSQGNIEEFQNDPARHVHDPFLVTPQMTGNEFDNDQAGHVHESFFATADDTEDVQPEVVAETFKNEDDSVKFEKHEGVFQFKLLEEEWDMIKPEIKIYGRKDTRTRRKLRQGWTDIFSRYTSKEVPGCVLRFHHQNVKKINSRKTFGPDFTAKATCSGSLCKGVFHYKIDNLEYGEIVVRCNYKGHHHSKDETNRRNISGFARQSMAEAISKSGAAKVFNQNILFAKSEELELGNCTGVPTKDVLRKMVSELIHKEYLHTNILHELQLIKEHDEKLNAPYIREIGLDPFTLVLYSNEQLEFIKNLSAEKKLDFYVDATGSIIRNIEKQKMPYLYSLVVNLEKTHVPVSLADMISTQHTIPRISHFFSTIKRDLSKKSHTINVRKIETDFSMAIVQAAMLVFNYMDVKRYLCHCHRIIIGKKELHDLTVNHICASHILQHFIRRFSKITNTNLDKRTRKFVLQCFAVLQNCTNLERAVDLFKDICHVFTSKQDTQRVQASKLALETVIKEGIPIEDFKDEEEDDMGSSYLDLEDENTLHMKTIREVSPFTGIFEKAANDVKQLVSEDLEVLSTNKDFCPEFPNVLLQFYMATIPMWSGMMLVLMNTDRIVSRDSNSVVENWFRYVKHNVCGTTRDQRPSIFVTNLCSSIQARIRLESFPGAQRKKTRSKQKPKKDVELTKEVWKKGKRTKGENLYHIHPSSQPIEPKGKQRQVTDQLPRVMKWGGNVKGIELSNTCTIDNGLTILHLFYQANERFRNLIDMQQRETFSTLLTVLNLMSEGEFDQAKLVWVRSTTNVTTNLYGDEADYFMTFFSRLWITRTTSQCTNSECPNPFIQSRDCYGITTGFSDPIDSPQRIVDKWLMNRLPCTQEVNNHTRNSDMCKGIRTEKRHIITDSPVLVLRVYEHNLYGRLPLQSILENRELKLHQAVYENAGVTMYRQGHYCAIIFINGESKWYDGLKGRLSDVPRNLEEVWFPVHVLYGRIK